MPTASPQLDVPTSTSRSATLAGLRAEVVPIALELGLLGAAAQFLTSLRATSAAPRLDLMGAFNLAREGLRSFQAALQTADTHHGVSLLAAVATDTARLRAVIVAADQEATPAEYTRQLADPSTSVDLLRRMIQFRTHVTGRDAAGREKLIALAVGLADRQSLDDTEPLTLRRAFAARGLLAATDRHRLSADRFAHYTHLRVSLETVDDHDHLVAIAAAIDDFIISLGDSIATLDGLAHVTSLRILLTAKQTAVTQGMDIPYDSLVHSFDGLLAADLADLLTTLEPTPPPTSRPSREHESVHPLAPQPVSAAPTPATPFDLAATLRLLESELRAAAARGEDGIPGITIDADEQLALEAKLGDPAIETLVVQAVVCRTAIDRVSREQSLVVPSIELELDPPIPPGTRELIRRAVQIEGELSDLNQTLVIQGGASAAKLVTRELHRLVGARVNLAAVTNVAPSGAVSSRS